MEPQTDTPYDSYPDQCACRTGCLFGDVRLTLSTGTPLDQYLGYFDPQWNIIPQNEVVFMGIDTTYIQSYSFTQLLPPAPHPSDTGGTPYYYGGLETRPPDGPEAPPPGFGDFDPDVAVGADFQRCSTGPESLIHLTANTSRASHVSHPHLVQEVCRCSVWKAPWY